MRRDTKEYTQSFTASKLGFGTRFGYAGSGPEIFTTALRCVDNNRGEEEDMLYG